MIRFARMPARGPGAAAPSSPPAADAEPAPALCAPAVVSVGGASARLGLFEQAARLKAAATIKTRTVRRIHRSHSRPCERPKRLYGWVKGPHTGSRTPPRFDLAR